MSCAQKDAPFSPNSSKTSSVIQVGSRNSNTWRISSGRSSKNRSEEHTSELQSLMRISYAVFCLKKKNKQTSNNETTKTTQKKKLQQQHNIHIGRKKNNR